MEQGIYSFYLAESARFDRLAHIVDQQMLGALCWQIAREEPERFSEMNEKASRHYWMARYLMGIDNDAH